MKRRNEIEIASGSGLRGKEVAKVLEVQKTMWVKKKEHEGNWVGQSQSIDTDILDVSRLSPQHFVPILAPPPPDSCPTPARTNPLLF